MSVAVRIKEVSLTQSSRVLRGPGQHQLPARGQFMGTLQHKTKRVHEVIFVVEGLDEPLLGRPAIESLNLVTRIDTVTDTYKDQVISNHPKLFRGLGKFKGQYTIKLQANVKPFALTTPRRVPLPLLKKVKQELNRMESLEVIRRVEEPTMWCAGMVVVPKRNGSVCICVDLTKLNEGVCRERHVLPSVDHLLAQLRKAKVFTKLDANSGFWQIPLSESSALLTTFITPYGRFCFNRLPFGISSAPEYFPKQMSQILAGLPGVLCMIDDILVFGKTQLEHDENLKAVLKRIEDEGATLNREKCSLSKSSVKFLGQTVQSTRIKPDMDKVLAIQRMPEPKSVSHPRRFLGMVNHFSKFTPKIAEKGKPLRDLLGKKAQWLWGQDQQQSFEELKKLLSSEVVLALYNPDRTTIVSADTSSHGL